MSIAASNTSMRVPAGFRNLLEGLAREVLREQPTDVVAFAAQYFQKLLESREVALTRWRGEPCWRTTVSPGLLPRT
ncbi:sperm surface protein Sp17 isoform X3 [Geospiza fortis]|uniref:Sperm surface protein Sp17 isoform X3 n=1 Tax=Geospiza fortis TaxID=48883 RepID=A0A8N5I3V3_GEOFO|nr:sperm surface protein Sp17 isoform X3 [Geospiza fortis]